MQHPILAIFRGSFWALKGETKRTHTMGLLYRPNKLASGDRVSSGEITELVIGGKKLTEYT